MAELPHRVRRWSFRARAGSQAEALALRTLLHDRIDAMLQAAARALDRADSRDAILRIPRLAVQIQLASIDDVAELAPRIEQALRQQLMSLLATPARAQGASPELAIDEPATSAEPLSGLSAPALGERAQREPPSAIPSGSQLLRQYLVAGALPWPLANLDAAVTLSALRAAAEDVAERHALIAAQPIAPAAQSAFWFRWLQLLPEASWPAVARAAAAGEPGARLVEVVAALARERALSRYARIELAAAAIAAAQPARTTAERAELSSRVRDALSAHDAGRAATSLPPSSTATGPSAPGDAGIRATAPGARAVRADDAGPAERDLHAPEIAVVVARLPAPAAEAFAEWLAEPEPPGRAIEIRDVPDPGARSALRTTEAIAEKSQLASPDRLTDATPARLPDRTGDRGPTDARATSRLVEAARADASARAHTAGNSGALAFGRMVHHAGLVVLHPFLARFFETTGVKAPGQPALHDRMLGRAAALLHLLATGQPEPFEFELDFIKLLLGLLPDAALPVSAGLIADADRDEVEALLAAVVEHWRALKRTSVQGLRASFLQRHGMVRDDDHGVRLQIAPAPFDVLLGQLPWGIAIVKLPWMKTAIFTEWPAP